MACRNGSSRPAGKRSGGHRVISLGGIRVAAAGGACEACADSCRRAVIRTYRELRNRGVSDRFAFEAGLRLYSLRHPEATPRVARDNVADWISEELGQ